jgi:hypothetical protein
MHEQAISNLKVQHAAEILVLKGHHQEEVVMIKELMYKI